MMTRRTVPSMWAAIIIVVVFLLGVRVGLRYGGRATLMRLGEYEYRQRVTRARTRRP